MWRTTALLVLCACGETAAAISQEPADAGADAPASKPTPTDPSDEDAGKDAGAPADTCTLTAEFAATCNATDDLNCGKDFPKWCALNDKAINSDAFRQAEVKCLDKKHCDGTLRRDCEYKSYASGQPTAAQKALVEAYCSTCEPGDTSCKTRASTYDSLGGPAKTSDVFVAAWEFNDAITDEMRSRCTGASLDAGTADGGDAGACAKAFGKCSGDVYFDHLPDCP